MFRRHSCDAAACVAQLWHCLQAALACFEAKTKLLEEAKLLRNAFVVTAQEPLPDDLVTAVQVAHFSHCCYSFLLLVGSNIVVPPAGAEECSIQHADASSAPMGP